MGMIRVSDEVEGRLKEIADGRSMNAVIEKMLAYCSSPSGFCPTPEEESGGPSILGKLDYLENYLDKRLSKLESLIEDTTVDRVAAGGGRRNPGVRVYLPDAVTKELLYEYLDEKDPEWSSESICREMHEADEAPSLYYQDGYLISEDYYGSKFEVVSVSPRIREFLEKHGVGVV